MKKLLLGLLFLVLPAPAFADAFSCNGKVVSTGDRKADVLMKCGEPAGKDSREEVIVERIDEDTKRKVTVVIDEWTYNLGSESLIRILTFRDGALTDVRTTGYGSTELKKPEPRCDDRYPARGSTKAEVLLLCGEPTGKDSHKEELVESIDADTKKKTTITIDEWTYNYGPGRFTRIFQFENNQLVDIRTGGYGN